MDLQYTLESFALQLKNQRKVSAPFSVFVGVC